MYAFFVKDKFPWLPSVLAVFVNTALRKAVQQGGFREEVGLKH